MKSLIGSFWFWLFLIGILLILTSLIIGGGMKKIAGWNWAIFVVGLVFSVLAIIFALYECFKVPEVTYEEKVTTTTTTTTPIINSPQSPFKSPTYINSNIPQAQRGFATTSSELSSLEPE